MSLAVFAASVAALLLPASATAETVQHTCAIRPFKVDDLGSTTVTQTEDEVRVEWRGRGSTTLNCPPGDSADGQALDVWEHAYYFWAPLPDDHYTTTGRGAGQLRFQNPIIFDGGSLTGAMVMSGDVACGAQICNLRMDAPFAGPDGARGRMTILGRVDLVGAEWTFLTTRDAVLRWNEVGG